VGIPTFADKVLQRAVVMVLEAIYEQDFKDCSYGFRPGRSAHQALQSLWDQTMSMGGNWIVEVDIRKFFDTIDHGHLRALLQRRVRDGVLLRLIGKWLNAGVLEEGCLTHPESGSPQGGVITPPTMLQTALLGATFKRGWTDPINDVNLPFIDFDLLDQRSDDLSSCRPIGLL
jgi:RNA-directed DNA polymerase